jgi:hypothetical protein
LIKRKNKRRERQEETKCGERRERIEYGTYEEGEKERKKSTCCMYIYPHF